jgi:hypothetical protein
MRTTILNQTQELKNAATKTGLLYCDNPTVYSLTQSIILRLDQIEKLLELENEIHFTEIAEAVKEIYDQDTNLTHINIKLQVRPIESEKKEAIINGKLYM